MTFSSVATRISGNGNQLGPRGRSVDHFVVHHAADSSLANVLAMMSSGSREVSANYVVKDGQIVGVVPEEHRGWSLSSPEWDGRSITVETCNSATGDASGWPISEQSYESLAKLIADCATRYGFPINRDRVLGHREVFSRHGASYATACPGGIDLDRLVRMAKEAQSGARPAPATPEPTVEESMYVVFVAETKSNWLITPTFVRKIVDLPDASAKDTIAGIEKLSKPKIVLPFGEFYGIWSNINAGTKDDSATGREIRALAEQIAASR
ncbi:peptidoglycan recognition family protein [Pseudoclavibacter sp. AY1H1]|uniref:peptidoglycan recognition protein family protein n=1 Tax=Pseudoclavibacter sp. AY1H1 TaxID=2080584 RepID=UPI0015E3EDE4|nr:peptidoglycan recognition family protein [Pseudoclavibacter sp. AY1H1]